MKDDDGGNKSPEVAEETKGSKGPLLVYVMLALMVGMLALFLLLRPRGPNAGGSKSAASPLRLWNREASQLS